VPNRRFRRGRDEFCPFELREGDLPPGFLESTLMFRLFELRDSDPPRDLLELALITCCGCAMNSPAIITLEAIDFIFPFPRDPHESAQNRPPLPPLPLDDHEPELLL
jgi:hypothetical protein